MFGSKRIVLIGLFAGLTVVMLSSSAQAGFIDDVPDGLADQLEVSRTVAELILSCSVLLCVGLVLAVAMGEDNNPLTIVIMMIGLVGMLTAIQWLDPWFLVMICMIIALLYASVLRDWTQSGKTGG